MTIKYLIMDDEPIAHKLITTFAERRGGMQLVGNCYSALEAPSMLASHTVDLIFLDINMPKMTGFEFLNTLQNPPQVIIVSAHREYALESYEYEITDYLLKPFNAERFNKAVQKAVEQLASNPQEKSAGNANSIYIKDDKKHHKVALDDIIYIKANGNYTSVYMTEGSILSQMKISDFEKLLPQPDFCRIHRSYLIAQSAITLVKAAEIHLGDTVVPVGRVYKESVGALLKS
ncbi:MAG: response regulator transcription factor [Algicola sp.]|nr:response regulator transcription factor [Algicola sp.]